MLGNCLAWKTTKCNQIASGKSYIYILASQAQIKPKLIEMMLGSCLVWKATKSEHWHRSGTLIGGLSLLSSSLEEAHKQQRRKKSSRLIKLALALAVVLPMLITLRDG